MRPIIETPTRILFLTTPQPSTIKAEWPYFQNYDFPDLLRERGASVTLKSWKDQDILTTLENFDVVTFLWCSDYYKYPKAFCTFLEQAEKSLQKGTHAPQILNPIKLIQWNADKRYLLDMEREGFEIPQTRLVDAQTHTVSELKAVLHDFPSSSVVLKPSMSASSMMTRRILNTSALTADDLAFLELCTLGGLRSSLLIQEFEPEIATGEYSFIFVGTHLTHVMLKSPQREDFRVQDEYGGSARLVDLKGIKLPALQVVQDVFETLQGWFPDMGYVRIDGLITEDRPFVLMEIEGIEPHLWLETGKGRDRLFNLLMSSS